MEIKIKPGIARGKITAPPSKSMSHRLLIAAALVQGTSTLHHIGASEDIAATIDCLKALGYQPKQKDHTIQISGGTPKNTGKALFCRESGSTLRFMIPLCLLTGEKITLQGSKRLMERPQTVYESLCREKHFTFSQTEDSITVQGQLTPGEYQLDTGISSQFITGMMFALSTFETQSKICLTGNIESRSYIDLTIKTLNAFDMKTSWSSENEILLTGEKGTGKELTVEGDYSNAAFFAALNYLGGSVEITGLAPDSLQGDQVYQDYFNQIEAGCPTLSLKDCPDLGPILMALAAMKNGAVFTDTARLKIKESNRGAVMAQELKKAGVTCQLEENRIIVPAGASAPQEAFCGHNDHRIVMALAVLATQLGGKIIGAEAVAKSFPDFFRELQNLNIEVTKCS